VSVAAAIAVDAMGGDRAPGEVVAGAVMAAAEGVHVLLAGREPELREHLAAHGTVDGVEIVAASDVIGSDEEPAAAVRAKPDSSLVTACSLVREGRAQGVVSAGSTGAMMAASLLRIGRIRGVLRPGIGVLLPTPASPCLLIDAGANVDCRPEHLVQFAVMGSLFCEDVLGVSRPRVALLSVGEESTKGDARTVEAHGLLVSADVHFVGNCEGRDALTGEVDVMVTDGFAGNVLLKGLEGAGAALVFELRQAAASGLRAKVGGLLLRPALRERLSRTDPETYGGAYLLGVRGLSVVAHGNSSRTAIRNAITYAARGVSVGVVERLTERLAGSDLREPAPTRTVSHVADRPMGDP